MSRMSANYQTPLLVTLALAFSIFFSTPVCAQTQSLDISNLVQIPLGPGPIMKQASEFASWNMVFSYAPPPKDQAAAEKNIFRRISSVAVTKTKEILHEVRTFSDGSKSEIWSVGPLQIQPDLSGRLCIYTADSLRNQLDVDPLVPNVSQNRVSPESSKIDFIGFEWVSKSNYRGAQTINNKDYFVFQGKIAANFLDFFVRGIPATAWIDRDTRLPFLLRTSEWTMTFEFGPPPTAILTLPADVQKVLKERIMVIKTLNKRNPSH